MSVSFDNIQNLAEQIDGYFLHGWKNIFGRHLITGDATQTKIICALADDYSDSVLFDLGVRGLHLVHHHTYYQQRDKVLYASLVNNI